MRRSDFHTALVIIFGASALVALVISAVFFEAFVGVGISYFTTPPHKIAGGS